MNDEKDPIQQESANDTQVNTSENQSIESIAHGEFPESPNITQVDEPSFESPQAQTTNAVAPDSPVPTSMLVQDTTHKHRLKSFVNSNKKVVSIISAVFIVTIIVITVWFAFLKPSNSSQTATNNGNKANSAKQPEDNQVNNETPVVEGIPPANRPQYTILTNATWLSEPEKMAYQPLFTETGIKKYAENVGGFVEDVDVKSYITFYKIGTDGAKTILIADVDVDVLSGHEYFIATKTGESFELIEGNSEYSYYPEIKYEGPEISAQTTINTKDAYSDIMLQDRIVYNGLLIDRLSGWDEFGISEDIGSKLKKIADTKFGTLYQYSFSTIGSTEEAENQTLENTSLYLKQPSGVYVPYRHVLNTVDTAYINDDNSIPVTWSDGTSSSDTYQWMQVKQGCGTPNYVNVLPPSLTSDIVKAGTVKGKDVYVFKSKDAATFKAIYDSYAPKGTEVPNAVTIQQMFDDKGVIVIQNGLGHYVLLVKSKYQGWGECGKPVIYLYPETAMPISVSVGADVTVSVPKYKNGWKTLALPSGKLLVNGGLYDSLFWEGTGYGVYPNTENRGFVVAHKDIEQTLITHLTALGLNEKESSDFMEFWLSRMPDTPYIRLTWLNTREMNKLAPLKLSKSPDTLIRIFLDFEGLDKPIALEPQKLTHPERKGFVVTEWGGLLRFRN